MKIAIIKYNAGNIMSVQYALQRLGYEAEVSGDPDYIRKADRVIFPGVGEASTTMKYLREKGFDALLKELYTACAWYLPGSTTDVSPFQRREIQNASVFLTPMCRNLKPCQKVPHMGWNSLQRYYGQTL